MSNASHPFSVFIFQSFSTFFLHFLKFAFIKTRSLRVFHLEKWSQRKSRWWKFDLFFGYLSWTKSLSGKLTFLSSSCLILQNISEIICSNFLLLLFCSSPAIVSRVWQLIRDGCHVNKTTFSFQPAICFEIEQFLYFPFSKDYSKKIWLE